MDFLHDEDSDGSSQDAPNAENRSELLAENFNSELFYPASYQQEQTFILDASGAGTSYNISWVVEINGYFNEEAMVKAYDLIVERESILRTLFRIHHDDHDENPLSERNSIRESKTKLSISLQQRVLPKQSSRSLWELCEYRATDYEEALSILQFEQNYNFDIFKAPISRLHIVRITNTRHVIMGQSHHIHHDARSIALYRRYVLEAYVRICRGLGGEVTASRRSSLVSRSLTIPSYKKDIIPSSAFRRLSFHGGSSIRGIRNQTRSNVLSSFSSALPGDDESNLECDYVSFTKLQRQSFNEEEYQRQLSYWMSQLKDAHPISFPRDYTATSSSSLHGNHNGDSVNIHIEREIASVWEQHLSKGGFTPHVGGMTLFHIMLSRWFNEKDVITGTTIPNRDANPSYSDRLGCYRVVLPIRSDLSGNPTYQEILLQIRSKLDRSSHAKDIPYHEVIANLADESFRGFNVMYTFHDVECHHFSMNTSDLGFNVKAIDLNKDVTKFDMHMTLYWNMQGGIDGYLTYSKEKFGRSSMQRFADEFSYMTASVAENEFLNSPMLELPMISPTDLKLIRDEWNLTSPEPPFPPPLPIASSLLTAMQNNSTLIAIQEASNDRSFTYSHLIHLCMKLAAGIQSKLQICKSRSAQPFVAMVFNRGVYMYASMLAVLLCGGILVPIDASHTPEDRVIFLLQDSGAEILIYDEENLDFISRISQSSNELPPFFLCTELVSTVKEADITSISFPTVASDSPACVMYTSGTTGKPKGVIIMHSNIHNSIYWWIKLSNLQKEDKVLHFSSYSFVMSIRQIYPTFLVGATLIVPTSAVDFESAIVRYGVTKMALTPSALSTIDPEKCRSLRMIQVAGEAPSAKLATEWSNRLESFYIGLGPTELCGHACCGRYNIGDQINIGMPVSNAAVYILNENGQIQPPGAIGELCVAGLNVASGYLNRSDLTQKHFVKNPFDDEKPRMYKVGDLARRLPDGKIEFIGRSDSQIKIRGFRIEVPEIVQTLLQSKISHQAHVLPFSYNQQTYLVAYVVPQLNNSTVKQLREYLSNHLPSYMVPQYIISLERFPLNKNGKLDLAKLPQPSYDTESKSLDMQEEDQIDRSNPVVLLCTKIIATELGFEEQNDLKFHKTFFEVGGTSLSAVRSVRAISEALSLEVKVTDLIQHTSLQNFIQDLIQKVDVANALRPATSDDICICGDFVNAQKKDPELHPFKFSMYIYMAQLFLMIFALLIPVITVVYAILELLETVGFPTIIPMLPLLYCVGAFSNLIITSVCLRMISPGSLDAGHLYPIRSNQFLYWWFIRRCVTITVNWFWFANRSKLINGVYRALGAKIGSDVTIDNMILDIPSLATIGNGCYIGFNTRIVCGEIRGNSLYIAPVKLESLVKTEPRSSILPGVTIRENCIVRAWASVLSTLSRTRCGKEIIGSPAQYGSDLDRISYYVPPVTLSFSYFAFQLVGMYFLSISTFIGVGMSLLIGTKAIGAHNRAAGLLYFVISGFPTAFIILLAVTIIVKRGVISRTKLDVLYSKPALLIRIWLVDTLLLSPMVSLALEYVLPPSLYHYFLIAMGGSVGHHAFWSSPQFIRVGCEHITIGEYLHSGMAQLWDTQTLSSDGIVFKPITVRDNCTIGQRAVIMPETLLRDRVTVGSEGIVVQGMIVNDRGTVVGNPPVVFANTRDDTFSVHQLQQNLAKTQGEVLSFKEKDDDGSEFVFNVLALILNLLKLPFVIVVFFGYHSIVEPLLSTEDCKDFISVFVTAIVTYVLGSSTIVLLLVFLTRSGIASFKKGYTGYYSSRFVIWWFCLWFNRFCSGLVLYPIQGTYLYVLWLRLIGAKIGKNCFIDPGATGIFEIDNIQMGDNNFLMSPNIHGHFVDHGTLQFASVVLGCNVRINDGATVMPFTSIGDNITLLTQCTTIKGSELKDPGIYMGNVSSQLFESFHNSSSRKDEENV